MDAPRCAPSTVTYELGELTTKAKGMGTGDFGLDKGTKGKTALSGRAMEWRGNGIWHIRVGSVRRRGIPCIFSFVAHIIHNYLLGRLCAPSMIPQFALLFKPSSFSLCCPCIAAIHVFALSRPSRRLRLRFEFWTSCDDKQRWGFGVGPLGSGCHVYIRVNVEPLFHDISVLYDVSLRRT